MQFVREDLRFEVTW